MVNWNSRKLGDYLWLANVLVGLVLINLLAAQYFFRVDLTEEKRYSIKPQTQEMLRHLDETVYVEVYLAGDLNAGFKRFQKSIAETLEEFRIYSGNKVQYTFTDPATAMGQQARNEFMSDLAARGIQPTNVIDKKDGQRVEKIIFPGALISYGGVETGVMLLKGNKAAAPEEEINQSIEGVEYELANAIYKLTNVERHHIGMVRGHGELDSLDIISFVRDLQDFYDVSPVSLRDPLDPYDALVIAKPQQSYTPQDKFALDQYIMKGGKVMFLLDKLEASMDSASREDYFAMPYDLQLDDLLFRYGVRINLNLVQDQRSALYPIVTDQSGGKPRMQMLEWPFFPLINHYAEHPITRNLDAVEMRFASSIDTVKAVGVKKTPLLRTSPTARAVGAPVNVSVNKLRRELKAEDLNQPHLPVAYLLEGRFTSLYKNRFAPEGATTAIIPESVPTRLLVFADGDLARNDLHPRTGQPQPLGFDVYANYTFANRELLRNGIAYLVDEQGLIQTRNKQVKLRPLNRVQIREEKVKWQAVNLVLPLLVLALYGAGRVYWRRRKYTRFS